MTKISELRDCPHCGAKVQLFDSVEYYCDITDFFIYCPACGCSYHFDNERNGCEKLIEAWNHRATDWISVDDGMPESGKNVWVSCEIKRIYGGKDYYTCEAFYADQYAIVEPNGYDYNSDYSEENDEYYLVPGWYEVVHNADDYTCMPIEDFVTHWMPLPEPLRKEDKNDD